MKPTQYISTPVYKSFPFQKKMVLSPNVKAHSKKSELDAYLINQNNNVAVLECCNITSPDSSFASEVKTILQLREIETSNPSAKEEYGVAASKYAGHYYEEGVFIGTHEADQRVIVHFGGEKGQNALETVSSKITWSPELLEKITVSSLKYSLAVSAPSLLSRQDNFAEELQVIVKKFEQDKPLKKSRTDKVASVSAEKLSLVVNKPNTNRHLKISPLMKEKRKDISKYKCHVSLKGAAALTFLVTASQSTFENLFALNCFELLQELPTENLIEAIRNYLKRTYTKMGAVIQRVIEPTKSETPSSLKHTKSSLTAVFNKLKDPLFTEPAQTLVIRELKLFKQTHSKIYMKISDTVGAPKTIDTTESPGPERRQPPCSIFTK